MRRSFMDNTYQKIFEILEGVLPKKWEKVVFYAEYSVGSYSMKYFLTTGDDGYIDCFRLGKPSEEKILRAFLAINKILSPKRAVLPDSKRWSVMTLGVNRNGSFQADYDYKNHDKSLLTWEANWKKKYLK